MLTFIQLSLMCLKLGNCLKFGNLTVGHPTITLLYKCCFVEESYLQLVKR